MNYLHCMYSAVHAYSCIHLISNVVDEGKFLGKFTWCSVVVYNIIFFSL